MNGSTINDGYLVSNILLSSTWHHGMCYEDLPYFPLNQEPHRYLEEEIHDKMKYT